MAYEVRRTITEDLDTGEFKFTGSESSMREDVGADPDKADKTYVDQQIGDINTILDAINGEPA